MTQTNSATDTDLTEVSDDQVAEFLQQNPDFFLSHADLLPHMEIPHDKGNAVSLVERQMTILRAKQGSRGFVHVLKLHANPSGVYRLVDEWKSPPLGWGTWSIMQPRDEPNTLRIADHTGHIWTMMGAGHDQYTIQAAEWAVPDPTARHYPGPITQMLEADFKGANETALLTQHLDWVVREGSGAHAGTFTRSTESAVPGFCTACDIDGFGGEDIVIPGLNGHLLEALVQPWHSGV